MFKKLAVSVFLSLAAYSVNAALIVGESFDYKDAGRLSTVSSSAWTSTSLVQVVSEGDAKFAEIGVSSTNQTAQRIFSDIPSTGTVWFGFKVYNGFSQTSLGGTAGNPTVRLGDASEYFLGLTFRPSSSTIDFLSRDGSASPFTITSTEVDYSTKAWREVVYEINLDDKKVNVYIDSISVLSNITIDGFSGPLNKVDFRGAIPGSGEFFRVDDIGFYNASPIPEPSVAYAVVGGFVLLVLARRVAIRA